MKLKLIAIIGLIALSLLPAKSHHGDQAWEITRTALFDRSQFCARNQDTCALPSAIWGALRVKAAYGVAFIWPKTPPHKQTKTASQKHNPQSVKHQPSSRSQNTLIKSDLKPRWNLS